MWQVASILMAILPYTAEFSPWWVQGLQVSIIKVKEVSQIRKDNMAYFNLLKHGLAGTCISYIKVGLGERHNGLAREKSSRRV